MYLKDLPNEVILHIFSFIDAHCKDRILGRIPDDPPPIPPDDQLLKDFTLCCEPLRHLATTCRLFLAPAQEQLLHAPIVGGTDHESIIRFVRTISARKDLSPYVKRLRVSVPVSHSHQNLDSIRHQDLRLLHQIIRSLDLPDRMKALWCLGISRSTAPASLGVLLGLLPALEMLCISEQMPQSDESEEELPQRMLLGLGQRQSNISISTEMLDYLPAAHSLTYLKLETNLTTALEGLIQFPNLHTLDLSMRMAQASERTIHGFLGSPDLFDRRACYKGIRHLRLDFQVGTIGCWQSKKRSCMLQVVQAFSSLESLDMYAESSDSKNPYSSLRAFPHYQANIQNYPEQISQNQTRGDDRSYWDERVYDARTYITDYQYLVDGLVHLRSHLVKLRLPGGFWTLPGGMRKPLPRFYQYAQLSELHIPQAAILSIKLDNMRFTDVEGDFDLSPISVLPQQLQKLVIFDADSNLFDSSWLRDLLCVENAQHYWPTLAKLKILLGADTNSTPAPLMIGRIPNIILRKIIQAPFSVSIDNDDMVTCTGLLSA